MLTKYNPDQKCLDDISSVQYHVNIVYYTGAGLSLFTCLCVFVLIPIVVKKIHYKRKKWERFEITIIICLLGNYILLFIEEIAEIIESEALV